MVEVEVHLHHNIDTSSLSDTFVRIAKAARDKRPDLPALPPAIIQGARAEPIEGFATNTKLSFTADLEDWLLELLAAI